MLILLLVNESCTSDKVSIPRPSVPPLSDFEIIRLDSQIYHSMQTGELLESDISYCYFGNIFSGLLRANQITEDSLVGLLKQYPGYTESLTKALEAFPSLDNINAQLSDALARYHYFFPEQEIPKVFTFSAEYQYAAISCGRNVLGIGLDMYLGATYNRYTELQYPVYLSTHFTPDQIAPDVCYTLMMELFGAQTQGEKVIDHMVHNGKLLYGVDVMLPNVSDQVKMKFTVEQMQWLEENEEKVWATLVAEDILFSRLSIDYRKLVSPSPNVGGFPPEAPGNLASWIGQQIVRKFMAENPSISMWDLAQLSAEDILKRSKYRP